MGEDAETKAIEKWLRTVDKPLATKDKKRREAKRREKTKSKSGRSGGWPIK